MRVVCIDDFTGNYGDSRPLPKRGDKFTVCNSEEFKGILCYYFVEITHICGNGKRVAYDSRSFRPLDETFADEVLERIKEEINEEQLVRI